MRNKSLFFCCSDLRSQCFVCLDWTGSNKVSKNDCLCFPTARVAVAQSSSLSLFTNRDAELEQRAMLLKRLAFTIYSSEVDQYQKYLPDIQGDLHR